MTAWAERTPSVKGLVLIGSRERAASDRMSGVDAQSDWDFQIITTAPMDFANRDWTCGLPGMELKVYATRVARIGGVPKVNAIFSNAEADFVVIPRWRLGLAKCAVALGQHRREGKLRSGLQDLVSVIRPGWRFLKGGRHWDSLYRRVVAEVPDPRLDDAATCALADIFLCESRWVQRKIARGELIAAQRMLHWELAETNFRLLHELKLRRGELSFERARRIERVATAEELVAVEVKAALEAGALRAAVEWSETTMRGLMRELVGERWNGPR
jgi:hypothetical protein